MISRLLLGLALGALLCSTVRGQSNLGILNGVLSDPDHQAVPAAEIKVTSATTGANRTTASDAIGHFEVAGLSPGEYKLEVSAKAFAPLSHIFTIEVGQTMRLDLALSLGSARTSVDVTAAAELLKTENTANGEVIEKTSVQQLPLNGRMLLDLALTVPGSHMGHGAQTGNMNPLYWRPGQNSSLTIGGNRPNANYFLIDGVVNTDPTFNTQNLSLSPDVVREFQVQTSTFSAEMGGAGGGQVNIVTKSGTSRFHGTAYEFLRNGALDAYSFNEMPGGKFLVQNNFGAAFGGPLFRKSTFFFANYEALRRTRANTSIDTVPTAEESVGDFGQSGVNIFNPFSSHSDGRGGIIRDPFPGNIIPANLLNRAAYITLNKYVP